MNIAAAILLFLAALLLALAGITRLGVAAIERRHPPAGAFADVNGTRMHYVHVKAAPQADLPPVVFIHGASGNLLDPMTPLRPHLEGRAELLFVDRPGHGWSGRGGNDNGANGDPASQATTVAALMDRLGISDAIIVGHSFGGATAAAFALNYPEKTRGLVSLSAATHPWPGGKVAWHYQLVSTPVIGWLFSETVALPAGLLRLSAATDCVFSPNKAPNTYVSDAAISLVLRPRSFRNNGHDVSGLFDHVSKIAPRYREIAAPTIIISGNRDTVVAEEIHSVGLARDIVKSELVWVDNLGHKPDYAAIGLTVAAIEKLAGQERDLQSMARALEARIAADAFGPVEQCGGERDGKLPDEAEMRELQQPL